MVQLPRRSLLKAKKRDEHTASYDYIDIVQWTTGDAQRRASLRCNRKRRLVGDLERMSDLAHYGVACLGQMARKYGRRAY